MLIRSWCLIPEFSSQSRSSLKNSNICQMLWNTLASNHKSQWYSYVLPNTANFFVFSLKKTNNWHSSQIIRHLFLPINKFFLLTLLRNWLSWIWFWNQLLINTSFRTIRSLILLWKLWEDRKALEKYLWFGAIFIICTMISCRQSHKHEKNYWLIN